MPVLSVACDVIALLGSTPPYSLRHVGAGKPTRMVLRWPVGRLPSWTVISSRISFVSLRISTMVAICPLGSVALAMSSRVGLRVESAAIGEAPYALLGGWGYQM